MSQNTRDSEFSIYKVILVGQCGVGKSNIISRYVHNKFQLSNNTTIGVEFISKIIDINGTQVNLQIWDTAGQQRFRSVNKVFYKNALGALVVFSLDSKQSFEKVESWLKQIKQEIQQNAVLILIGNKSDLKQRQVSVSEASKLAKQQNMAYIQTSAALNINVDKSFEMLTQTLLLNLYGKTPKKAKQSIFITKSQTIKQKKRKKKCCDS